MVPRSIALHCTNACAKWFDMRRYGEACRRALCLTSGSDFWIWDTDGDSLFTLRSSRHFFGTGGGCMAEETREAFFLRRARNAFWLFVPLEGEVLYELVGVLGQMDGWTGGKADIGLDEGLATPTSPLLRQRLVSLMFCYGQGSGWGTRQDRDLGFRERGEERGYHDTQFKTDDLFIRFRQNRRWMLSRRRTGVLSSLLLRRDRESWMGHIDVSRV